MPPAKMKILLILAKKVSKNSNSTPAIVRHPTRKPEPVPDIPRPIAGRDAMNPEINPLSLINPLLLHDQKVMIKT